jgi:hypothetical protein
MFSIPHGGEGVDALLNDALDQAPPFTKDCLAAVRDFLEVYRSHPRQSTLVRLFGRNPIPEELRAAFQRACGEVSVSDALTQLGPGWMVFRAMPADRGPEDLEYIAIGPAGIYSIAVRQHPGRALWINGGILLVEGERMPHIREAEFEAVRASQLLSEVIGSRVEVTPCLVIVEPRSLTVAKPPRRVAVLTPRDLRPWLRDMPRVLSTDKLDAFRAAAIDQESWQDVRTPPAEVAGLLEKFRKVQSEVSQARHVKLTWVTGALVLFWLVSIVGIGGFTTSLLFR